MASTIKYNKNLRAQISLEFLIVIAVYLAFLSILIHTEQDIAKDLKLNLEKTQNSLNADSTNILFSLERIYTSSKLGPIVYRNFTTCKVNSGIVYCDVENASAEALFIN